LALPGIRTKWETILENIQQIVPQQSFNTWFRNLTLLSFTPESIQLGAANRFIKSWVEKHYLQVLREVCEQCFGNCPEIVISISSDQFKAMRQTQEQNVSQNADTTVLQQNAQVTPQTVSGLNPKFTLDRFATGECNRLAYAAALSAINNPGTYNPVCIYGGHGLGKTHLLHAIARMANEKYPEWNIQLISAEAFCRSFTTAITSGQLDAFHSRFRRCDLLLIDDIHILAQGNKAATQEDLLHTFDELLHAGKQIVLSADQSPDLIEKMNERLRSRFQSGLCAELPRLDTETRKKLALLKAEDRKLSINPDALEALLEACPGNPRELEGAVGKLSAVAQLTGHELTREVIEAELLPAEKRSTAQITIDRVSSVVAREFGVSVKDLQERSRTKRIGVARKVAIRFSRTFTRASLSEIGSFYGNRSHATILSTLKIPATAILEKDVLLPHVRRIASALGQGHRSDQFLMEQSELF